MDCSELETEAAKEVQVILRNYIQALKLEPLNKH
jgi:hypothetical protein